MARKKVELNWNVLIWGYGNKLRNYNILHKYQVEEIYKAYKKKKFTNMEELKQWLKSELMYHYWCKAEYEILVGELFTKDIKELEKIDAWRQIEPNLDVITKYVNQEMELGLE